MIKKVLKENKKRNKKLRQVSTEVKNFNGLIKKLIIDLKDTMKALGGVGIAAPQIGVSKRVILVTNIPTRNVIAMINPKIISSTEEKLASDEACLSVPIHRAYVERKAQIEVEYFDIQGQKHHIIAMAPTAFIIQHEIDHLNGVLFTDYLEKE